MNNEDRKELFEIYSHMVEDYNKVKKILRNSNLKGIEQAESYWLGNIDIGLNGEHYFSYSPNFKSFLKDNNIIDDDEIFIDNIED